MRNRPRLPLLALLLALALPGCDKIKARVAQKPLERSRAAIASVKDPENVPNATLEKIMTDLSRVLQWVPENEEAHALTSQVAFLAFLSRNDAVLKEASTALARVVKERPRQLSAHRALGELAIAMGDFSMLGDVRAGLEKIDPASLPPGKALERNQTLFRFYGAPIDYLQRAASRPGIDAESVFVAAGEVLGSYERMRRLWSDSDMLVMKLEAEGEPAPEEALEQHRSERQALDAAAPSMRFVESAVRRWEGDPDWRQAYTDYYAALAENDAARARGRLRRAVRLKPEFVEAQFVLGGARLSDADGDRRALAEAKEAARAAEASLRRSGPFVPFESARLELSQVHVLLARIEMREAKAVMSSRSFRRVRRSARRAMGEAIETQLRQALALVPENENAKSALADYEKDFKPYLNP